MENNKSRVSLRFPESLVAELEKLRQNSESLSTVIQRALTFQIWILTNKAAPGRLIINKADNSTNPEYPGIKMDDRQLGSLRTVRESRVEVRLPKEALRIAKETALERAFRSFNGFAMQAVHAYIWMSQHRAAQDTVILQKILPGPGGGHFAETTWSGEPDPAQLPLPLEDPPPLDSSHTRTDGI